jgi:hypothetical protein
MRLPVVLSILIIFAIAPSLCGCGAHFKIKPIKQYPV